MAIGDNYPVLMGFDKAVPDGVATLDKNGKLAQMPSAADVGALKIYTRLSELGLEESTAAMSDIVTTMAKGSILLAGYGTAGATAGLVPASYGLLSVKKHNDSYTMLEYEVFNPYSSSLWRGYYNGGTEKKWSGWYKNVTTDVALMKTDKPSGSYTGNGDATVRTIDVGGIGEVLAITAGSNLIFATKGGGVAFYLVSGGTVTLLPYSELRFQNGVLTISTASGTVNGNGYTFNYQVL